MFELDFEAVDRPFDIQRRQRVRMQFAEFGRVVAAQVDEKQFVPRLRRRALRDRYVITVGLLDLAPAIEMQAFGIAPPFLAKVGVTILRRCAEAKADIVQLDIGGPAIAADVKHEEFHGPSPNGRPDLGRSATLCPPLAIGRASSMMPD